MVHLRLAYVDERHRIFRCSRPDGSFGSGRLYRCFFFIGPAWLVFPCDGATGPAATKCRRRIQDSREGRVMFFGRGSNKFRTSNTSGKAVNECGHTIGRSPTPLRFNLNTVPHNRKRCYAVLTQKRKGISSLRFSKNPFTVTTGWSGSDVRSALPIFRLNSRPFAIVI